jgi:hypothetical protein
VNHGGDSESDGGGDFGSVDPALERQVETIRNLVDSYMGIGTLNEAGDDGTMAMMEQLVCVRGCHGLADLFFFPCVVQ